MSGEDKAKNKLDELGGKVKVAVGKVEKVEVEAPSCLSLLD